MKGHYYPKMRYLRAEFPQILLYAGREGGTYVLEFDERYALESIYDFDSVWPFADAAQNLTWKIVNGDR